MMMLLMKMMVMMKITISFLCIRIETFHSMFIIDRSIHIDGMSFNLERENYTSFRFFINSYIRVYSDDHYAWNVFHKLDKQIVFHLKDNNEMIFIFATRAYAKIIYHLLLNEKKDLFDKFPLLLVIDWCLLLNILTYDHLSLSLSMLIFICITHEWFIPHK